MKVDVYPNINKVEVYENPISVPVDASWEKVLFTIEDANDTTFVLPSQPMLDRDGDFVLKVFYNAVLAEFSVDYTVNSATVTWLNRFPLEANELVEIWYAPKSAYGSVPGSGEVTSLNHLNDVSIAGPITGQLLVRNNDGKFQNKSLIAGDNISITNDNADITIASNPNLPLSHLSANGTLENNNAYAIDTSSAPITMQLPATSTLGKVISVQRLGGEQLTVSRNGHNINALAQDITVGDGETVIFRYLDTSTGWIKSSSSLMSVGANGAIQTSDGSGSLVDGGWAISTGHLLPSINGQYDIGSATNLVRDIYLSNNSLKFGAEAKALSVNAQNKLEFDGTELSIGSGIEGLSFSGTLSNGEVIKYDGSNWVNASVDYTQVSNTPSLSAVATTGDYTDISGTPSLSTVATSGAYSDLTGTPSLATVATSGAYGDLTGAPSLATVATTGSYNDLANKPSLFSGSYNDLTNLPSLFSGSYADLTNKPTLGTSASLDVGTSANNVVQLDANGKLPIIDGSQLTNVTATDSTKLAKANNLNDLADASQARTNLGVDVAGTDNSTDVTLANVANNYLSITNQEITSGTVPLSLGGTGATDAVGARAALGVDASGTDNSTDVTLANTNYLTITGQEITGGTVPVASGGTGATAAAYARTNLGVDASGTDNSTNVTLANTNYLTITGQEITGGTVPVGSGGTGATDATNARTNLGLGTSATLDHGTSAGNLVRLDPATSKLPAVDGSLLTNLPSGASELNDLSDVVINSVGSDQVVVHNGTNFVNAQLNYSQVSGTPSLATVATSGDYADLANKPTIPTGLNSLSDVSFTAGSGIDGYVLTYSDTNSQWEALQSTGSASVAWDEVGEADSAVDIVTTVGDITVDAQGSDTDIVFKGKDGSLGVEMLRLDASEGGTAIFNNDIILNSDTSVIKWGADSEIELTHVHNTGLVLKAPAGTSGVPVLNIQADGTGVTGPKMYFKHNGSDANSDVAHQMIYQAKDSGGSLATVAFDQTRILNNTSGSVRGNREFYVTADSGNALVMRLEGSTTATGKGFVNILSDANSGLKIQNTHVTASGNELNILSGATLTTTELNLLDGGTTVGNSVTIADTDGILLHDAGYMKKIPASDLKTYIGSGSTSNIISQGDSEVTVTDTGANGTINFKTDNTSRWDITSNGHILPASNASYDIGSADYKVRHLFLSDNSLKFVNSADTEFALGVNGSNKLVFNTAEMSTESYVDTQIGNLGSASTQDVGTSANNVVQLDASANIDVSSNSIVTASNADIDLVPNGSGKVKVHGNATSGSGQVVLNCENNSHGISLKGPPHSAQASYTLTFPNALGSDDQVLKTDASGNLDWVDPASGGGFTYELKTSSFTADVSYHYGVKTSLGAVTMSLPPRSESNDNKEIRVKLKDNVNFITISADGSDKIDGSTNDVTLSTINQSVTLVASLEDASTRSWELV